MRTDLTVKGPLHSSMLHCGFSTQLPRLEMQPFGVCTMHLLHRLLGALKH
jgi:hypothetical protein